MHDRIYSQNGRDAHGNSRNKQHETAADFHQTSFKIGISSEWEWQNGRHAGSIC